MNIGDNSCSRGGLVQRTKQVEAIDHRHQTMFDAGLLLSFPKSSEAQDRPRDAAQSQLNSLFRRRDPKPIRSLRLEPARTLDSAMAVGIRLYYRHDFDTRPNVLVHNMKIGSQRRKIDLRPRRPLTDYLSCDWIACEVRHRK